ncbi:MAG: hypothetical protein JO091_03920 [Acidobacteriaceae bacterium]|nr:hypothetical protein [Acidobacteriaceae bacterium]
MLVARRFFIFVCATCSVSSFAFAQGAPAGAQPSPAPRQYVGSTTCKPCHPQIYARWEKTRITNVVRDPKQHPDAILPDLSKRDPLVTFKKDDIAFVYGSKWKQRYFKKIGEAYFVLPAQWDVTHQIWRPYFVRNATDWWAPLYPPDRSCLSSNQEPRSNAPRETRSCSVSMTWRR